MAVSCREREAIRVEITVSNHPENAARVRDFVHAQLGEAVPARPLHLFMLGVDEAVTNAMNHAYGPGVEGTIDVRIEVSGGLVRAVVCDQGPDFDPLGVALPDVAEHVRAGRPRGLGLVLIRRIMDRVAHARIGDVNELTLERKLNS